MSTQLRSASGHVFRYLSIFGLMFWAFFTLFPLYWVLITAFKPPLAVIGGPTYFPWIDFDPSLKAWRDIAAGIRGNFKGTVLHSTLIGITASTIATLFGSMAAYALVRFPFRVKLGSGLIFFVIAFGGYLALHEYAGLSRSNAMFIAFSTALVTSVIVNRLRLPGPILDNDDIVFWFVSQRMFPPVVVAFALFLMFAEFGRSGFTLIDTFWGMTLCYTAFSLPIVVWLMRDFFRTLPIEVEEAALIDNVPSWRIFKDIVVPMSAPGLAATFIITLAFVWNEFLFALFLTNSKWQTLPILVAGQNSQRGDEWWSVAAANLIAIIPMFVVALVLGRLMRSGLTLGAIK